MAPPVDPGRRLDLMLELGAAQTRAGAGGGGAGDVRACRGPRPRAGPQRGSGAGGARRSASSRSPGSSTSPLIALLEEALDAVGPEDGPLRSQLLSALAQGLYWIDPAGRSEELGIEALEMARRIDDSDSLAQALIRRQFTGGASPERAHERLRESDELHDARQAPGRSRARAARPRLPAGDQARHRRGCRRRPRPRRVRAPCRPPAPAAVRLARARC